MTQEIPHILIADDNPEIREIIKVLLTGEGFSVTEAKDGTSVLTEIKKQAFDLIILDIMMPGMNGFTLCRKIRETSDVPIIFITARVLEEDKLNGYSLGADDYVTKPFSLPVLYAKAMALMGRIRGHEQSLKAGSLTIDLKSRGVRKGEEALKLPPKEYDMLLFFLENPGRIYSRDQLLIRFWGYDFDGNERVVDNHIKKLRKVIGDCGCTIRIVRKLGYWMEVEKA